LSENRVDDLLSHFPVGKEVRARIIGHMTGENLHLLTFRESVVEAEFFRYDSFSATQIVVGKVCKVNTHGWVTLQLAPHLYGQITPNHVGNSRMSNENLEAKYKLGSSHRVMVLDKSSDRVFLTAKPSVMKTKGLKRFTDLDDVSVGAISLGTIVNVHASSIIVQFFNNIKAYVPISQLSHEFIKDTKTNFEAGQVVRCRVLEVCPERENQLVGSLVLEPGKKEKKSAEKSEKTSLIGSEVTVTLDEEQPANMIMGKTAEGMKLTLSERDFSLDPLVASTFYNLVRTKKSQLENVVVETKMRDNVKGSKIQIVKAASTRGWNHRCGSKLDDMEEGKLLLGQVVKKTEFGFQVNIFLLR
jgi:predicted RNA-binding protein with RPS1 domain